MIRFFNGKAFLVGLAIGLAFVYFVPFAAKKIVFYPTPDNSDNTQYRDKAGVCFNITPYKVSCPKNKLKINKIPAQQ